MSDGAQSFAPLPLVFSTLTAFRPQQHAKSLTNTVKDRAAMSLKARQQPIASVPRERSRFSRTSSGRADTGNGLFNSPRSIMIDLLQGGPVPTKLNNLRLKRETAAVNSSSSESANSCREQTSISLAAPEYEYEHKVRFLESPALSPAIDKVQFLESSSLDPTTDVIVGVERLPPSRRNPLFQRCCVSAVPAFRAAIAARAGEAVKKIVFVILQAVADNGGHFVTLLVGSSSWREVCRNVAERFVLDELRKQSAAHKERATTAATASLEVVAVDPLPHRSGTSSNSFIRRVSPPDLKFPSQVAFEDNEQPSSHRDREESPCEADDEPTKHSVAHYVMFTRPDKQRRLSGMDSLYLLSEAAAQVEALDGC